MALPNFSSEQLARQAGLNATATILSIFAFLKKHELSPRDWVRFIGLTFAASWEPVREQGARKAMELVALDMCSIGARLVSLDSDGQDQQAEAVFENWPDAALLKPFNLTPDESLEFMEIFAILANYIDLNFEASYIKADNTASLLLKARIWPAG